LEEERSRSDHSKSLEYAVSTDLFDRDPAATATEIIGNFWGTSERLVDGRFGQRPHKLSLASAALAHAMKLRGQERYSNNYSLCLGNILSEISVNGTLYPLNSLDHKLLEESAGVFDLYSESIINSPSGKKIEQLMGGDILTWEEWLALYKAAAAEVNAGLSVN
jgi:hypothetical protein